jgi:hypothetical protein
MKEPPDPYIVSETRKILASQSPEKRAPVLAGALLSAYPDAESIAIAREICVRKHLSWMLVDLLRVAPDAELITRAYEALSETRTQLWNCDLIEVLLQADPQKDRATKAARRWLRKNGEHQNAGKIRFLLSSKPIAKPAE